MLMIDNGEADDKIIAVLDGDNIWGEVHGLVQAFAKETDLAKLAYCLMPNHVHFQKSGRS